MLQQGSPDDTGHFQGAFPAVVDMSVHSTKEIERLKELGVKVIIRYYALERQSHGLEEKRLEKDEADAILDKGLSLAMSYQYNNGIIDTFTDANGRAAANYCLQTMDSVGQPNESAIYFGVDNGWNGQHEIDQVIKYFTAINDVVRTNHNRFVVGVYGSGLICEKLASIQLAKHYWVAGLSDAWPGRPHVVQNGGWNMYQNVLEVAVGSIRVDTNIVNPTNASIGSFHRPSHGAPAILDGDLVDSRAYAVQRLVKGDSALLYDRPGGTPIPQPLVDSKMVIWIRDEGEFSLIEVPRQIKVNNVNVADFVRGYCAKDKLAKVDARQ